VWEWVKKVIILGLHVDALSVDGKLLKLSFDWEVKSVIRMTAILKLLCSLLCPVV